MYKQHYSRFLSGAYSSENPGGRLHFCAHSHHPWPDVSRAAQVQYWDHAAELIDAKWDRIFSEIIPQAQSHIAALLGWKRPSNICFAPNTHEFVCRILSCFPDRSPIRILTTDSEFHSFTRQSRRLEEVQAAHVTRVPTRPFATFEDRLLDAAHGQQFDLIFFSHVFFNSGVVVSNLPTVIKTLSEHDAMICVDGYHSVGALPLDIGNLQERIFYLGGGYKYLQYGEGGCYLAVPTQCAWKPVNTGWFAAYEELEKPKPEVIFSDDGFRFWGATFDPTALFRLCAVMQWMKDNDFTVTKTHQHVQSLQRYFMDKIPSGRHLKSEQLLSKDLNQHGHFLSFELADAERLQLALSERQVITDRRERVLRFGFGIYHDTNDIDELGRRLASIPHW